MLVQEARQNDDEVRRFVRNLELGSHVRRYEFEDENGGSTSYLFHAIFDQVYHGGSRKGALTQRR